MMMLDFGGTLLKILPIIALIVLGFIMQKVRFFKDDDTASIKKIVVNIALPSLLYGAFYRIEADIKLLVIVPVIFFTCAFMIMIGHLLARLMKIKSKYFPLLFGGFETGMLGYAIFSVAYGTENLRYLAIVDLGQVLFVFFVLVALIARINYGSQKPAQQLKMFVSSPVIIAIFLGIMTSVINSKTGFAESGLFLSFYQLITLLGSLTAPLICIIIGYELKIKTASLLLPLKTIIIRMMLLTGLALLICEFLFTRILTLEPMFSYALIAMFILPPPFVIPIFMQDEDEEKQYVLNCLSLGIVFSLVAFTVVVMFSG